MIMTRFLLLTLTSAAAAFSLSSRGGGIGSEPSVSVWDDVLPAEEQRAALHERASRSGLEHRCFSRPLATPIDGSDDDNTENDNIIERTLDAILTEIENGTTEEGGGGADDGGGNGGGNSRPRQYVEYWTRQEWRHIEAHADVDENLSKRRDRNPRPTGDDDDSDIMRSKYPTTYRDRSDGGHRYPVHGHVLYLRVGSEVRGPTCVFPGRSSGGDLLKSTIDERSSDGECESEGGEDEGGVKLVTVPAVPGRLLRFDGRDLHAVPRPHDLWMLPFVRGSAQYEPEEEWGRSVILFNVWPGDEDPPLDVPLDTRGEGPISENETRNDNFCGPFSEWSEVKASRGAEPSSAADPEPNRSVKVWLLGNERRREYPMRTVPLVAPAEGGRDVVRKALAEKSRVTELRLRR